MSVLDLTDRAARTGRLEKHEIIELLGADGDELRLLYESARKVRENIFGKKIFLYGFVYFSTWCGNDCNFCYYRKSNLIDRYRKSPAEVLSLSQKLAEGVHLIDLTMGEDPSYHKENFQSVIKLIKDIRRVTGLPVMISPGLVEKSIIDAFADAGAEWFALYQETYNRRLFKELRLDQDYDRRMDTKLYAKEKGMLIEEGILTGVGESTEDIAESILGMSAIGARQLRVMSFVPQKGSPMENYPEADRQLEYKIISILRLINQDALIPASLDVDGISGLEARVLAGANVITSIIPPYEGLMGVAQSEKDVNAGGRTSGEVIRILRGMGLESATREDYREYIGKA